jgi:RNA polymerase sigma-70 factor, ECF subfamily
MTPEEVERRIATELPALAKAWPGARLDTSEFGEYVSARLAEDSSEQAIGALHLADLYLAFACSLGQAGAIAHLEPLLTKACVAATRTGTRSSSLEDLTSLVRQRVLVSEGGGLPKIATYSGQGSLQQWLKAVAARAAVSANRKKTEEVDGSDADEQAILGQNAELRFIQERYREPFKRVFRRALAALTAEERSLLRLHVLDGMSHADIGRSHGVHQSTATRWIANARAKLVAETRAGLRHELGISRGELDSLIRVVRSGLDISLTALMEPHGRRA